MLSKNTLWESSTTRLVEVTGSPPTHARWVLASPLAGVRARLGAAKAVTAALA